MTDWPPPLLVWEIEGGIRYTHALLLALINARERPTLPKEQLTGGQASLVAEALEAVHAGGRPGEPSDDELRAQTEDTILTSWRMIAQEPARLTATPEHYEEQEECASQRDRWWSFQSRRRS